MEKNIIKVEVKEVYGVKRVYVLSEHKEALEGLTGQKTLSDGHIKHLKALGFTFETEAPKI